MLRIDLTLPTLAENLALDEALLLDAESGGPAVLRFWSWSSFAVVVGAGGQLAAEAHLDRCAEDRVPVVRRGSGGGTVLLGPGCLLYSLVLPFDAHPSLADLNASYRHIMGRLAETLSAEIPGVALAGTSDLTWRDRKVSGNAQQRKRTHLLHHGTILYDFDLGRIMTYVQHPPRMPVYRRDRSHADFVANLPIDPSRLRTLVAKAFHADESTATWPSERTRRLVEEKYALDEWRLRR